MAQTLPKVLAEVVEFKGGLDLVTPAMAISKGACIDAVNFEPDKNGGYRRINGYERFDGRPSPTDANYWIMPVSITGALTVGQTITGATSLSTAVIMVVLTGNLVLTKLSAAFSVGENIQVAAVTQATCLGAAAQSSAASLTDHAQYKYLASNVYRTDIAAVPGTGPVRGVWYFEGQSYAFRDSGANCQMYKATSSGWALQTFGYEVHFVDKAGAPGTAIKEGDTVTGATSGKSGVVKRVLLRTGLWNTSPVGTLVFDSITGAFTSGEALNVGGVGLCQTSAASSQISLLAGGRFEFINYNLGGGIASQRMYFCDGVNRAHEWDGTRLVPIPTGTATDTPTHITCWQSMLVVSIASSVMFSGIGSPYSWTALTGAYEIALGDLCTGLLPQQGTTTAGALAMFCAGSTRILYGASSASLTMVVHSMESGAAPFTQQNIGSAYYLDTKGVVSLVTTQNYGNFASSAVTGSIQPLIDLKRGKAVASCVIRSSNQYRVFYNDGTGLIIKPVSEQTAEVMYFDYGIGQHMHTVASFVAADGAERILAGGSDGFVYELNKGTSFDGANIRSWVFFAFNSSLYPRLHKRYRRIVIQASCATTSDVKVGYELDYGSDTTSPGMQSNRSMVFGSEWVTPGVLSDKSMSGYGGYWDLLTWDDFVWDSPYVTEYVVDTPGNGSNIGLMIYGDSAVNGTFVMSSCVMHYMMGRQSR